MSTSSTMREQHADLLVRQTAPYKEFLDEQLAKVDWRANLHR